ncbi:uncharacterized protein AKAW2_20608A [Aspergillus luchuensis]|uniref:Uncharacterized protein n=1 Tax=Aspergillus kawachii TaxID=1069201 RepID=A0A7R7W3F1_ASPKA|nr:uncharacterized protein AKAW2_20608A [Aspergillus luchuensis]BCR95668.1 hypothetical protein AKAW2_20608A [Aspergillus luchuensis]BCS08206.1 hypothetical protein ALUC_20576A [Aspergillus luchuensis]
MTNDSVVRTSPIFGNLCTGAKVLRPRFEIAYDPHVDPNPTGYETKPKDSKSSKGASRSAPITAPTQTVHVLGNGPRGVEEGSSLRPVRMRVSGGQWAPPAKGEAKSRRVTNSSYY